MATNYLPFIITIIVGFVFLYIQYAFRMAYYKHKIKEYEVKREKLEEREIKDNEETISKV